MPPSTPSNLGVPCPLAMETAATTTTEAAWMKIIRRKRSKLVISRNARIQATNTLEKSIILEMAPPLQIGERNALRNRIPIIVKSSFPSLGTSLKVRLVRPRLLKRPHIARMEVILAKGTYLRPGIQSSGLAQYTTKKQL